ncbi:MAG: wax ester/triacylglycerol synthase family O-acyltransferase [Gammaproteobacteria bacterium]|nr:wax ester/triacylglycerol synthase family O-acyltransferase [Gammaproteobacteria bacterium]
MQLSRSICDGGAGPRTRPFLGYLRGRAGEGQRGERRMTAAHERMSSVDTAWLRMDGPGNVMMIVGVSATATPIHPSDFRRMIEQRLLCFSRFRHRPVADALGASWVEDLEFDLDAHVKNVVLPAPAGKAGLQALAADLAGTPLDPRRPMWQFHFVEKYEGGSAWITRVHHCYADGIAMIRVLLSMTEQDSGPALAGHAPRGGKGSRKATPDVLPVLSWIGRFAQPGGDVLEHALAEGAKLLEGGIHQVFHPQNAATVAAQAGSMVGEFAKVLALPDDPDTPLRGRLTGRKVVAWAEPIPLHEVKTIGKALDCTINDVLMSTVAGALGSYLRDEGFDTDELVLRASVPVNLRAADEPLTLGNKFGLVFVDMAVGLHNPLQRVFAMHETMAALKGSLQPPMTLMVIGLMGLLPAALQAPAIEIFSRKGSAVVSNVPGPQSPLYMCGQRITEMYFWVPQSGTIGLGISILSYAGKVYFGVIADRSLVKDPGKVVERFAPEFEKLLLAVTVGALAAKEKEALERRTRERAGRKSAAGRKTAASPGARKRKSPRAQS